MQLYVGQYFLFPNKIAKITYMEGHVIKLRNMSHGNTEDGYDYQSLTTSKILFDKLRNGQIQIIKSLDIMKLIFKEYIKQ